MRIANLVRSLRADAGLSVRALADAAGVASSTLHRIEQGELQPTMDTLSRIGEAAGVRLQVAPRVDYAVSIVGLARSIREDVDSGDAVAPVRKAAELVHRFGQVDSDARH